MEAAEPHDIDPDDRQIFGSAPGPDLWATRRGIEGRHLLAPPEAGGPLKYLGAFLLPWDQIERMRGDLAKGSWAPPYVRLGTTPGDEPPWVEKIPGGPIDTR